ncbi:MAG: class I SAM-dependent rRNA methyltransferase [Candidatus Aminicenantes bacterium]|nr:class I SAM-dependent rRNA methyltransferase [Candidatus Aminicenantes bacterium]
MTSASLSEGSGAEAVILHPGKEKAIRNRHHWIFSGAVRRFPDFEDGSLLPVRDAKGGFLGCGYFNRCSSIVGRMITFDETPPDEALEDAVRRAIALRTRALGDSTDAYRVINGEGDGIPGLIVDRYGNVLVLQVSTLGIERLKPVILDLLERLISPETIIEKSNLPSRKEEGMAPFEGLLRGRPADMVEIRENGLRFQVNLAASQKTGFYLDQRENRVLARSLAPGRRVMNAFCYTGGFTVAVWAGGAESVASIDISGPAVELARSNVALNGFENRDNIFTVGDVFEVLRERDLTEYDLIILDPPAFAKRKSEVVSACRGYKDIHRIVFQKCPAASVVLTFSCSYFVDDKLFRQVVFQAAGEAGRRVRILGRHRQAADHPVNIFHPESDYLKGLLLYVD